MTPTLPTPAPTCTCPTCGSTVPVQNDRAKAAELAKDANLTPRQFEALVEILRYRRTTGRNPTCRALGKAMEVSQTVAWEFIQALKDKRVLNWAGRPRE